MKIGKNLPSDHDGIYWHKNNPENKKREEEKEKILIKNGYSILRIREDDYYKYPKETLQKCIDFIYERKLNKANKRIKENLNFKNRILGMLSHELRSPLKIIGLFINKINKKTNDDSIKEYLKSISFTNNTLLIQANQILEYTKNQQVENKLIPVVFNLKNEINAILTSIKPYMNMNVI